MIKLEHVVLASPDQMEFIIEGMRNPMNSWDKSDSGAGCYITKDDSVVNKEKYPVGSVAARCETCTWCEPLCYGEPERRSYILGENDHSLMQRLSNAGTDHRKFMRMMPVYVRITAPLYWWKEFDTYKVGTVANSCSTMHKIMDKEFTLEDFSTDQLSTIIGEDIKLLDEYKDDDLQYYKHRVDLSDTIRELNLMRSLYLAASEKTKANNLSEADRKYTDAQKKKFWRLMIQLLPSSYNQTRNVMMNYEVLANIYKSRKDHKLDEWREFCKWIESLPFHELITDIRSSE